MSDECKHVILNDNMFVNNACKYIADTGMILLSQKKRDCNGFGWKYLTCTGQPTTIAHTLLFFSCTLSARSGVLTFSGHSSTPSPTGELHV